MRKLVCHHEFVLILVTGEKLFRLWIKLLVATVREKRTPSPNSYLMVKIRWSRNFSRPEPAISQQ